jgi:hypothetical protein
VLREVARSPKWLRGNKERKGSRKKKINTGWLVDSGAELSCPPSSLPFSLKKEKKHPRVLLFIGATTFELVKFTLSFSLHPCFSCAVLACVCVCVCM